MRCRIRPLVAVLLLVHMGAAGRVHGATWLPGPLDAGTAPNGVNNAVEALTEWDPDGAGPQSAWLVVGGNISSVQGVAVNGVAARDPVTGQWRALGSITGGSVRALAVYNGDLVAGGSFTSADGHALTIARWDGTAWQPMGGSPNNFVYALAVYNGELVAGGYFTAAGASAAHVARWNGFTWQPLGAGVNDWVYALAVYNGELIVGGYFTQAGGQPAAHIARWNASIWQPLGAGTGAEVTALGLYNGDVVAGGRFTTAGGQPAAHIARWNSGTGAWSPLGGGVGDPVLTLIYYQGSLIVGGAFATGGGAAAAHIARWNGATWQPMAEGLNYSAYALWPCGNDLVVGGDFTTAGPLTANHLARWDGSGWGSYGGGALNYAWAMIPYRGRLVTAGWFNQSTPTGPMGNNLVTWDGLKLGALGTGMNGPVLALEAFLYPGVTGNNELIAGGEFTTAGGVAAANIARWNERESIFPLPAWAPMGAGFNNDVLAVERHASITYAGGSFTFSGATSVNRIARWNETTDVWEPLGAGMNSTVYALKSYGGSLYAGGAFTTADGVSTGGLARWDGTTWSAVGGFFNGVVYALEVHDGELIVGGLFPGLSGSPNIVRYDGATYATLGSSGTTGVSAEVRALHSTGTQLYVGGAFTNAGGVPANRIAMWDGAWHGVQNGLNGPVYGLSAYHNEIQAAGGFSSTALPVISTPGWARHSATGLPWLAFGPGGLTLDPGATATFSAEPAAGYGGLTFQWLKDNAPVADGPNGFGSTRSGATTKSLKIVNVNNADEGDYTLVVSNASGSATSAAATLIVNDPGAVPGPDGPGGLALGVPHPNPSSGAARLSFTLARASSAGLRVLDVSGRLVRAIELGALPAGAHETGWDGLRADGTRARAGVYFVLLEVDGHRAAARSLTLVR